MSTKPTLPWWRRPFLVSSLWFWCGVMSFALCWLNGVRIILTWIF